MANATVVVAGITLLVGGVYGVLWGVQRRKPYELITGTPTTRVGQLTDTGIVELNG